MSDTNPFAEYTARLREFIAVSLAQPAGGASSRSGSSFDELARGLFELQFAHNPAYRRFCEGRRVSPQSLEHWSQIPAVPTAAFKELELSCLPPRERTAVFHSSGTTEQRPSRHFHNAESLAIYEASLLPWFRRHALPEGAPRMAVLSLSPSPAAAPRSSLVHMFDTIRRELGSRESVFLGESAADGTWELAAEAALQALERAVARGEPVLLLGTAFSYVHLLDFLAARGMALELPPGSRAMETGGYKGRSRALPKAELHSLITARLGIPASQILCEYGMSELSSQAYDHSLHAPPATPDAPRSTLHAPRHASDAPRSPLPAPRHASDAPRSTLHAPRPAFHFPPWARAQIICPESGQEVAHNQTGLVRLFDLANVYSVLALQTEDLGIRRGHGFELLGRAALAEARGCSLMAR